MAFTRVLTLIFLPSLVILIGGCSPKGSSDSKSPIASIVDSISDIFFPEPGKEAAKKEISKIKEEENKSELYSLNQNEIQDLQSQIELSSEEQSELSEWTASK